MRDIFLATCVLAASLTGFMRGAVAGEIVAPEYFGLHIHKAADGTAWPEVPFGSWRLWDAGVAWRNLEPTRGNWQFAKLSQLVALADAHGVAVVLPLGLSPTWAAARPSETSHYGDGAASEPASMDEWRRYIRTVAMRYGKRIRAYEIWNEPNDKGFFSGSTQQLVKLTCAAYKTLKAIDSRFLVVSPAYTGAQNVGKLEEFLAAGGRKCVDVIAYHLYAPEREPEAIIPIIGSIKHVMAAQGVSALPLWNTESGWWIVNEDGTPAVRVPRYWRPLRKEEAAAYLARSYLLASAFGVERFFWYSWDNTMMGLIEPNQRSTKPIGFALGVVGRWMVGRKPPLCREFNGMWTCELERDSSQLQWVVWSQEGTREFVAPDGWKVMSIVQADGKDVSLTDALAVDGLPKLVVLGRE